MVVLVLDAAGNPVPSATVNWAVVNPSSTSVVLRFQQTTTGANGQTVNYAGLSAGGTRYSHQVTASIPSSALTVTFDLTQGAPQSSAQYAFGLVTGVGTVLTGTAGSTSSGIIQVQVRDFQSVPLPNVSIRLVPAPGYTPGASISCVTASGADPGSVLTDATGTANCTPVFGPFPTAPGTTGTFYVLIGGVAAAQNGTGPIGYEELPSITIQVSPGVPTAVSLVSGNQQTASAGQNLTAPLVAQIQSSSGSALAGETVTWNVTPAAAATLSQTSTASDVNGRVSTVVTFSASAFGPVQITVTTANGVSASFAVNATAPVTSLIKVSGDGQAATVNTDFAQPLVVQVGVPGALSPAGIPVQFSISGPGTLNNTTVATSSSGTAAVAVTAGSSTGTITVTATAGAYSAVFTLVVALPGPVLTPSSFVNGAGLFPVDATHSAWSPCAVGTIIAPGIAPAIQGAVTGSALGPWPYQLAQVTVAVDGNPAPIEQVSNIGGQQQLSFQVPCNVAPANNVPVVVTVYGFSTTTSAVVRSSSPGIFEYAMSDGARRAVLVRADGTFVSLENPAHPGDVLRMFATGVGQVLPSLTTDSLPIPGINSVAVGQVSVRINGSAASGVTARRAPQLIGVDEVTFQVPSGVPSGNDLALLLTVTAVDNPTPQLSNLSKIPIE